MGGTKFFGEWLVEKGVITREQLLDALDEQKRTNLKLGEHAVRLGYLTPQQVDKIRELQRKEDLQFGEAAVKLGYLTPQQVKELLRIQKSSHKLLGDILVEKGFITRDELQKYIKEFEKEQGDTTEVKLPEGIKERELIVNVIDLTKKFLLRSYDINVKFGEYVFDAVYEPRKWDVMIKFSGDSNLNFIFSPPEKFSQVVREYIEARFSREFKEDELIELIKDAIKEFVNVVAGNAATKMERLGKGVEIGIPENPPKISGEAFLYTLRAPSDVISEEFRLYFVERR